MSEHAECVEGRQPLDLKHLGTSQTSVDAPCVCQKSQGSFTGIYKLEGAFGTPNYKAIRVNLTCKQWDCPACSKRLMSQLMSRLWEGELYQEALRLHGLGSKYHMKFLTLTVPGTEYRERRDVGQAEDDMAHNWNKLRTAMKKRFGDFHYFMVYQPQRDGYPHYHILMVGEAIASKEVLPFIRGLWCKRYGMGNVDIKYCQEIKDRSGKVIRRQMGHPKEAIGYMTRYMAKGLGKPSKWHKVYRASIGALGPRPHSFEGEFVMGQIQGTTIQMSHSGYGQDFMDLFLVRGYRNMLDELQTLIQDGDWDPAAPVIRGKHPDFVRDELNSQLGLKLPPIV